MGKFIVVLCAVLFVVGFLAIRFQGLHQVALNNQWNVSWLLIIFVGLMIGGYKLVSKG